jgi:hypothetical protein
MVRKAEASSPVRGLRTAKMQGFFRKVGDLPARRIDRIILDLESAALRRRPLVQGAEKVSPGRPAKNHIMS